MLLKKKTPKITNKKKTQKTNKTPCNLLFFDYDYQYSKLKEKI